MIPVPEAEQTVYASFDRERGLRLARLVALAFGAILLISTLVLGGIGIIAGNFMQSVFIACTIGVVALAVALGLVQRTLLRLSSSLILGGVIGVLATIQVVHAQRQGLDAVSVSLFGMYGILCALGGVLVDTPFMFSSVAVANVLSAIICIGLSPSSLAAALLVTGIVCAEEWVAVLLTFGAQTLYLQTLHELGDLRLAIERAQRLDDLKNQFIRSINHELRNPVMAWYGATEVLQQGAPYLSTEQRQLLVDQSVDIGKRVVKLVKSILEAPRLEGNVTDFVSQPVLIQPAIVAALDLLDPQESGTEVRDIHISAPDGIAILGEETRFQQILVNLISNALKYSPQGSPVDITAIPSSPAADRGHPTVTITVRDYGLGVPPSQQSLLFERFVRLPRDLASNIVGNGLGLYLCRVLATAMGGSISVSSTGIEGEGSTFTLVLPASADLPSEAEAVSAPVQRAESGL